MKYYTINEEAAANAKAMYSWFEYKHGTKTTVSVGHRSLRRGKDI